MAKGIADAFNGWNAVKSSELYGVDAWGSGYFGVSSDGFTTVCLKHGETTADVKLFDIVTELRDRGMRLPVLLRFSDILASRIRLINETFAKAIADYNYQGRYRGVYPIKVNQQQQAVQDVVTYGKAYHHGLEAGSKAELIAALAYLHDPEAYIVCNGYKDEEFVSLALSSLKMGLQTMLVLESLDELDIILETAKRLNVKPRIGVRVKLSSKVGGKWSESGGDRSVFGLTPNQLILAVDRLRAAGALDCLEMLHYHLGSQVPNIREIRDTIKEASRFYVGLVKEGAPMGIFDIGGGLAIDYDGSQTNFESSANYDIAEYCADVVEGIMNACDQAQVAHPTIISESGRALIGYYSVLLVDVLATASFEVHEADLDAMTQGEALPECIANLLDVAKQLRTKNLSEYFNDALYYREEVHKAFKQGLVSLRQHAAADRIFWSILTRIRAEVPKLKYVPEDLRGLDEAMADIYYCNFSVFQSLPDAWAIDQLFPFMPIHRLCERPTRSAHLSDITCDCDGQIDKFIDLHDVKHALPLHVFKKDEDYILGAFLVGAYQETLGDLHNLFGDTNVVSIRLDSDGELEFTEEVEGDTVEEVLSYVEYNTSELVSRFRRLTDRALKKRSITAEERRAILEAYASGLRGYTYFEA
ncbi:MAG: biosynthetic arginine decarboxylase [Kiritimatiellae bacterium]|nr:biosynthetic arginine decarboxylase [Kiritimatiellia bacterium]